MTLAKIKNQIDACQSLDELKEISKQLGALYQKQPDLLSKRAGDAMKREQWQRLNEPMPLMAGDVLWTASAVDGLYSTGCARLRAGTELIVVAIQPRAKRIWVKTPPGFGSRRAGIYFDDWRELRHLRRAGESNEPVAIAVSDPAFSVLQEQAEYVPTRHEQ
jgi:hypothetical protein